MRLIYATRTRVNMLNMLAICTFRFYSTYKDKLWTMTSLLRDATPRLNHAYHSYINSNCIVITMVIINAMMLNAKEITEFQALDYYAYQAEH